MTDHRSSLKLDCYKRANSKANFAIQLVRRCYSRTGPSTSNYSGDHRYRKRKLSSNALEGEGAVAIPLIPFVWLPGGELFLPHLGLPPVELLLQLYPGGNPRPLVAFCLVGATGGGSV